MYVYIYIYISYIYIYMKYMPYMEHLGVDFFTVLQLRVDQNKKKSKPGLKHVVNFEVPSGNLT